MSASAAAPVQLASLAVILTGRCNLGCAYCYRSGGGGGNLAEERLREALDWAMAATDRGLEVAFSGGEPTLRFDVFARAVVHLRTAARRPASLTVRLVSNGTLLTDRRLDFLAEHEVDLNLSTDGHPRAQTLRGDRTGAILDDLLARLRRRHPDYLARRLRAVLTLLPRTVDVLAASVERLLDAGIRDLGVSPVLSPVPGWDDDLRPELADQLARIRVRCAREHARSGEIPFLPLRRFGPSLDAEGARSPRPGSTPCAATRGASPVLDTDGQLYACLMFAPSGLGPEPQQADLHEAAARIRLGHPGEPDYGRRAGLLPAALAAMPAFLPQDRLHSRLAACADCPAVSSCRICPHALLRFAGNPDCTRVPAFLCSYYGEVARQRALTPAHKAEGPARLLPEAVEERRRKFREEFGLGD